MGTFWDSLLAEDTVAIREEYTHLWDKAGMGVISPAQAVRTLNLMFARTHLDLYDKDKKQQRYFPTQQGGPWNGLHPVKALWWLDHATAGVNGWGTLDWFSSRPRVHTRQFKTETEARTFYGAQKPGARVYLQEKRWCVTWEGYAGAVTHFVEFLDGTPFYLVKIDHCAWGEPKRNRDSIQVEMVNPLVCQMKKNKWHYWAGPIPQALLDGGLAPITLDKPFRGATHMMPYTWAQIITNIKLKRLCNAVTGGAMARERMSTHTDWREGKFDMGPLWPRQLIDDAAFENIPVEEYDFVKAFVNAPGMDNIVNLDELRAIASGDYALYDVAHNTAPDTNDSDTTLEVQRALLTLYGSKALPRGGADGHLGPETTYAVKHFQRNWNHNHPVDTLRVDGIPGVETCVRLNKAVNEPTFKVAAIN